MEYSSTAMEYSTTMEPYTLRDRINYLISSELASEVNFSEKNYGYGFTFCPICHIRVVNDLDNHLGVSGCKINKIWLNERAVAFSNESKPDIEEEVEEEKVCYVCNGDEVLSPMAFIDHLNSKRHKFYVELEQKELKEIKVKVENWLETGIYHKTRPNENLDLSSLDSERWLEAGM